MNSRHLLQRIYYTYRKNYVNFYQPILKQKNISIKIVFENILFFSKFIKSCNVTTCKQTEKVRSYIIMFLFSFYFFLFFKSQITTERQKIKDFLCNVLPVFSFAKHEESSINKYRQKIFIRNSRIISLGEMIKKALNF